MKNIYILTLILTSFIFSEGDDKLIDNSLCRTITKDVDKYSGQITFRTPFYDKFVKEQIVFTKIVDSNSVKLYLSIDVPGHSLFVDEETTLLLLDNGKKIQWNNSIDVEYYDDDFYDWIYSSFVTLDKEKIDEIRYCKNKKKIAEAEVDNKKKIIGYEDEYPKPLNYDEKISRKT